MNISILSKSSETEYAALELRFFLNKFTSVQITQQDLVADRSIVLTIDKDLNTNNYSVHGDGKRLEIQGGSTSSLLCGVYEALSQAGILFEATGYSVPHRFDLNAFFSVNQDVCPKFGLRGIRQHINFPMDISSYALPMAKEYIRSLARMRYNTIVFHSYDGQWHEGDPNDPNAACGLFFFGDKHLVPEADPLTAKRIENRKYFCIPEIEPVCEDDKARSDYAKYWLNQLMQTAKEAGMTVAFSLELHIDDEEVMMKQLHKICETYPLMDILELITDECGSYLEVPGLTPESMVKFTTDAFGTDILDENGILPGMDGFLSDQFGGSVICLQRILRAIEIRESWLAGLAHRPALRAGLYITDLTTLKILFPILRKKLPAEVWMSLIPAHGAVAVVENLKKMELSQADWERTIIHSWAEFDGNMYVQQQSTDGIEQLCSLPETDRAYGMSINHWRTAENNLTISYAAEAAITAKSADDFYRWYAEKKGIGDAETFVHVSVRLAALDTYLRDNLFNIGFCHAGCWLEGGAKRGGIMLPLPYGGKKKDLVYSIAECNAVTETFKELLLTTHTKEGIEFLRLMINRCQSSALHLSAMLTMLELEDVYDYDNPVPLTEEQWGKISNILARAKDYAEQYLHLYGEMLPDRGGQGQLVSYYQVVPVYIDAVAASFQGSEMYSQTGKQNRLFAPGGVS